MKLFDCLSNASPRLKARVAGAFYLLTFLTGAVAAFSKGQLAAYEDAANLIATACYVVVTVLFYDLFRPVSKQISLIAALFGLAGCALGAVGSLHLAIAPVNPLVLFGFYCLLIGYLIFNSGFLPRVLGVLMAFGGLSWLTFFSTDLVDYLAPYNMAPGILAEGLLTLWLLSFGVNIPKWQKKAGLAS
jgi:hypothetical protein